MEYREFKAKTVEEAITAASLEFGVASEDLDYEVVEKGSAGFLGLGSKPAIINAKKKDSFLDDINEYLENLFKAMDIETEIKIDYDAEASLMNIDIEGPDMGILIGKRGQTLDALQYLISLYVNKKTESYIRVKLDTENYRVRRKDTLENLARNIAFKVKRTRRSFTLEPMNPYERRIIHTSVQKVRGATSWSEGENASRHVVIGPDPKERNNRRNRGNYNRGRNNNRSSKPVESNPDRKPLDESGGAGLYGRID